MPFKSPCIFFSDLYEVSVTFDLWPLKPNHLVFKTTGQTLKKFPWGRLEISSKAQKHDFSGHSDLELWPLTNKYQSVYLWVHANIIKNIFDKFCLSGKKLSFVRSEEPWFLTFDHLNVMIFYPWVTHWTLVPNLKKSSRGVLEISCSQIWDGQTTRNHIASGHWLKA